MSGDEDTKTEQVGAEEMEDEVMMALPNLDASRLEAVYDVIGLDLEEDMKGKKRELRKKLLGHLTTLTDDGGDYNQISTYL